MTNNKKWITEKIFNSDLAALSDNDFIKLLRELPCYVPNVARYHKMWNGVDSEVLEIRKDFISAVTHLVEMSNESRYRALSDFITGEYAVKNLKRAFWSEMIRVRFQDVPLLNEKTEVFFRAIGFFRCNL